MEGSWVKNLGIVKFPRCGWYSPWLPYTEPSLKRTRQASYTTHSYQNIYLTFSLSCAFCWLMVSWSADDDAAPSFLSDKFSIFATIHRSVSRCIIHDSVTASCFKRKRRLFSQPTIENIDVIYSGALYLSPSRKSVELWIVRSLNQLAKFQF